MIGLSIIGSGHIFFALRGAPIPMALVHGDGCTAWEQMPLRHISLYSLVIGLLDILISHMLNSTVYLPWLL